MKLDRTVVLNPIEPEFLAFRLSSGIETKIDFHFKAQNGAPHAEDVVAQLQMTSRSRDQTEYYSVPAIDVVNGIARATIPAGLAYDPNGWRLRLTGTVNQEPRVIAYGVVTAIAGAGPQVQPQDVIDTIDLVFERNSEARLTVKLWDDTGKTDPFDLASATISANIYSGAGGPVLTPFAVTVVSENAVELSLTVDQVNSLPDACWWSMSAAAVGGITTLAQGHVAVTGTVTPSLPETTALYDYLKPAGDVNPVGGQIIHGNVMQNLLRVAKTTQAAIDLSATLELIIPGDQIVIGTTTWTVGAAVEEVGWYEFTVTPVAQDAVTGVTTVTFKRP